MTTTIYTARLNAALDQDEPTRTFDLACLAAELIAEWRDTMHDHTNTSAKRDRLKASLKREIAQNDELFTGPNDAARAAARERYSDAHLRHITTPIEEATAQIAELTTEADHARFLATLTRTCLGPPQH